MTTQGDSSDARVGRPEFLAWLTAFAGWTFDYYEIALMTFLVVPITAQYGLSDTQTAMLLSIQLLGIAVGGVVFGYLGDRIGRRRVLMITIAVFGLFTLARGFVPGGAGGYVLLLVFGFLAALGLGGEFGVGQSLVSEVMPPAKRGRWGAALYSGAGVGLAGAALVGGYLLPVLGWRWVFVISCIPIVLAIVARFSVPESETWTHEQTGGASPTIDWALVRSGAFVRPLVLCLTSCAISFFGFYGVASFLPTYLIEVQGFSFGRAAWFTVVVGASITAGALAGGWCADRFGRRITWAGMAIVATSGAVMLGGIFLADVVSPVALLPVFVMYFGTSGGAALFGLVFAEQFPTRVRSLGVGTALQVGRGLSFFPPLIAAAVYPVYGYAPLVFGAAVLFAVLALLGRAFTEGRGRTIADIDTDFDSQPHTAPTRSAHV